MAFLLFIILVFSQCLVIQAEDLSAGLLALKQGKYSQARDTLQQVLANSPDQAVTCSAAVGLSRVHAETGEYDEAIAAIEQALDGDRDSALLWARLAELHFMTGEYTRTKRELRKALDLDSQQPLARLVQANLRAEIGELEQAAMEYRWFVRQYNKVQPDDADTLIVIGEGAAQYARWESISQIFRFIVNDICPDALKADENCWQAAVLSGTLLLEKYNQGQALPEFEAALKINENCAAAHLGFAYAGLQDHKLEVADSFADQALKVNPNSVEALLVKCQVQLLSDDDVTSRELIEQALTIHPVHQKALACKAITELFAQEFPMREEFETVLGQLSEPNAWEVDDHPFWKTLKTMATVNPRPGVFLNEVGGYLDARRKFELAELFYRTAIDVMPQLSAPRTALGMLAMRTGNVDEAEQILNDAFKSDPFHVRISNMRKVIGILKAYEVVETEHFVIRVPSDELALGKQMALYLEEIYPELVERYGYEPPTRTQFEVYGGTEATGAHAWFSARMSGLPWIQTIGASTGMIVALASPNQTEKPYHWARVLRHEFMHILTLQKTQFNIPHWYTEALSVVEEHMPLPEEWQQMLQRRVPADKVFRINELNRGFQQPKGPSDWQMAYCQSFLCAQYMKERFGEDALDKLLNAYVETPATDEAFGKAFNVDVQDFQRGYLDSLNETVAKINQQRRPLLPSVKSAQKQVDENPDDPDALAELAAAIVANKRFDEADTHIDKALGIDGRHPLASALHAFRLLRQDRVDEAMTLLNAQLDFDDPHPLVLELLAKTAMKKQDFGLAQLVLEDAIEQFPLEDDFQKEMIEALDGQGAESSVVQPYLEEVARRDIDAIAVRKRLARISNESSNHQATVRWAREATYVDVNDPEMHRLLAKAHTALGEVETAIVEYETLELLDAMQPEDRLNFAQALRKADRIESAKDQLKLLLQLEPDNDEAQTLFKLLDR